MSIKKIDKNKTLKKTLVSIIMGSENDLEVMNGAALILEDFGVPYEIMVVSAHRTPSWMYEFAHGAEEKGIQVIIAGAGGAAHLPGMVASMTPLPVIGVPVRSKSMDGLDSLLSIVQMPKGVPVATVAIDNSSNAALLALRILSLSYPEWMSKLKKFNSTQTKKALKTNKTLKFKKKLLDQKDFKAKT